MQSQIIPEIVQPEKSQLLQSHTVQSGALIHVDTINAFLHVVLAYLFIVFLLCIFTIYSDKYLERQKLAA